MPVSADMYYYEYDGEETSRPPIVLIHGAGGTHLHWPASIRRLSGYRVYALDLPGHGKSGGCGKQSVDAYAHSILNWMQTLGLPHAVFVGHSMGGAIALRLSILSPKCVLGIALVGSGARLRVAPAILENTALAATFPAAVETIIKWAFSPETDPKLVELAAKQMAETRPTVLHGDFLACDAFDETESLSKIRTPALAICGQDDRLTPPRYSQYLADHIPGAELNIISAAGHLVMLEKPKYVANILVGFLNQIPFSW
ncbi:MAG: alpha/beta hydrolase [Chloroflexota bacterium]|nr:alpha/beta hydrolase [Chloroflexota bacterium]